VAFKKKYVSPDFYPLKKMIEEGREGFKENLTNPYSYGTSRYKEWERGFNKTYHENLRRLVSYNAINSV
jgi:hypothetical protein|tara:strand:- start:36 stop:242 length:207 start_codon:yes stop_codon:yes gene_type:complete